MTPEMVVSKTKEAEIVKFFGITDLTFTVNAYLLNTVYQMIHSPDIKAMDVDKLDWIKKEMISKIGVNASSSVNTLKSNYAYVLASYAVQLKTATAKDSGAATAAASRGEDEGRESEKRALAAGEERDKGFEEEEERKKKRAASKTKAGTSASSGTSAPPTSFSSSAATASKSEEESKKQRDNELERQVMLTEIKDFFDAAKDPKFVISGDLVETIHEIINSSEMLALKETEGGKFDEGQFGYAKRRLKAQILPASTTTASGQVIREQITSADLLKEWRLILGTAKTVLKLQAQQASTKSTTGKPPKTLQEMQLEFTEEKDGIRKKLTDMPEAIAKSPGKGPAPASSATKAAAPTTHAGTASALPIVTVSSSGAGNADAASSIATAMTDMQKGRAAELRALEQGRGQIEVPFMWATTALGDIHEKSLFSVFSTFPALAEYTPVRYNDAPSASARGHKGLIFCCYTPRPRFHIPEEAMARLSEAAITHGIE